MDLRLPNITAPDTAGKLNQLQRYLYALVEQLNWELGLPPLLRPRPSPPPSPPRRRPFPPSSP